MTTLTHTVLATPIPQDIFCCTFNTSILAVCWKPMWFPLCSFSWSDGCFCSFCNCIQLCVFRLKNFRSKQDLDRLKWFLFLKEVISLSLLEGIIRIFTNNLCIIATDTSRKYFLQSMALSSKCHVYFPRYTVREKTVKA